MLRPSGTKRQGHTLTALCLAWLVGCAQLPTEPTGAASPMETIAATPVVDSRHVLVVAGDELPAAVFHARPLQTRIGAKIRSRLSVAGHVTYDHQRLNLLWDAQRRLTDQQLLDSAAHLPGVPLDALVIYSTVTQPSASIDAQQAVSRVRIQARVFDVSSRRLVATHEQVDHVTITVGDACDGYCYMELLGDALEPLALNIGDETANSVSANAGGHRLVFHGFDEAALVSIEKRLMALPDSVDLTVVAQDPGLAVWLYRSRTSRGLLHRRLQALLRESPSPAQMERTSQGFVVRRLASAGGL